MDRQEAPRKGDLKRRFFVAVMPPAPHTGPIDELRSRGPGHWDWKGEADYHISLAFPGLLDDAQVEKLVNVLRDVRHQPFDLAFTGLSTFIKDRAIRSRRDLNVLWARPETSADTQLRALQRKIAQHMARHSFHYGARNITPHLTVAKVPANDNDIVSTFAAAHDGLRTPSWRCDHFALYETLEKGDPRHPVNNNGQGSRYIKVAEFALK